MAASPGQLNLEESPSWGSRSVERFEKLEQIGEGTYGQVYMAKDRSTGEVVALKKIRMDNEKEGFPITAIREIKLLKKLQHENVIQLKEIVTSPGRERNVKRMQMVIGSNLLINNEGNLKLADFGLARSFSNDQNANLTNRVITLWYRPPELLLGATKYGPAVDLWSVGCIFAELLHGKPILPGKNETEQLSKIFELCGTPDEINWPGVSKIPWYNKFKPSRPMKRRVREVFRHFDRHALDLLDKMLILDPSQRISAKDALDAEYFWADPLPCDPKSLPKYEASHEFQTKKKRQQQRQNEEIAKRQKLPHPHQHARLPPIQHSGPAHSQHWGAPNYPLNNPQAPYPSGGAGHHQYSKPHGAPGAPNRYPPGGNPSSGFYSDRGGQAGNYSSGSYPPQGRGPPYPGSGAHGTNQRGSGGGYAAPQNYSQSNQYGGSAAGRGNRNQQYGWQQ